MKEMGARTLQQRFLGSEGGREGERVTNIFGLRTRNGGGLAVFLRYFILSCCVMVLLVASCMP